MPTIEELKDKRGKLATEIRRFADEYSKSDDGWKDAEQEANFERLNKDHDALLEQLKAAESVAERLKAVSEYDSQADNPDGVGKHRGGDPIVVDTRVPGGKERNAADRERDAALGVAGWMRGQLGMPVNEEMQQAASRSGIPMHSRELRFGLPSSDELNRFRSEYQLATPQQRVRGEFNAPLATGTATLGGNIIPPESLLRSLELNMLQFGGMRQVAQQITTTSGEPLSWPTADDTSNEATIVAESASIDASGAGGPNPTFGKTTWNSYKFHSGTILVPSELLEDSVFNLPSLLGQMIGERIGRGTNRSYTTGTGSSQPEGILTNATVGVSAAGATAITTDEVYDLQHSVDPAYRAGAQFMCSDAVLLHLRKKKDANNNYIWQSGFNTGAPDTIAGVPYVVNQHMPAIATGNKTLIYGQLDYYKIRRVNQVRFYRLQELYRGTDKDGFVALVREDGGPLSAGTAPFKVLQQA